VAPHMPQTFLSLIPERKTTTVADFKKINTESPQAVVSSVA